jgi:hypothetical protein
VFAAVALGSGGAQCQSTGAARNIVRPRKHGAAKVTGGEVAAQTERDTIDAYLFYGIYVGFDGVDRSVKGHVQVLVGIRDGSQQVSLVWPISDLKLVARHETPPLLLKRSIAPNVSKTRVSR